MVGVPGKSKGCHTCRQRKIKCDEGKPDCQKCLKSGRKCEGFEKRAVFLNRTAHGLAKRKHLEEATLRSDTVSIDKQSSGDLSNVPRYKPDSNRPYGNAVVRNQGYTDQPPTSPPPKYVLLEGLTGHFHQKYVPHCWRSSTKGAYAGNWIVSILVMPNRGPTLTHALSALVAAHAAKDRSDGDLKAYATAMYSRGLLGLQDAITSDETGLTDETLAAVNCLKMYEFQEATGNTPRGYDSHTRGLEQLVIRRGARNYETTLGQQVLYEAVFSSMIVSLMYRKTSPISKTLHFPTKWKSPFDVHISLLKFGFDLASIIDDLSALAHLDPGPDATAMARIIYARSLEVRSAMHRWHWLLTEETDLAFEWHEPLMVAGPATNPLFYSKEVQIDPLRQRIMMVDWWVFDCMQWRISCLAAALLPRSEVDGDNETRDVLRYVQNIAGMAPILLAEENGLYCSTRMVLPLRFAVEMTKVVSGPRGDAWRRRMDSFLDFTITARGLRHASTIRGQSGGWEYMQQWLQKHEHMEVDA